MFNEWPRLESRPRRVGALQESSASLSRHPSPRRWSSSVKRDRMESKVQLTELHSATETCDLITRPCWVESGNPSCLMWVRTAEPDIKGCFCSLSCPFQSWFVWFCGSFSWLTQTFTPPITTFWFYIITYVPPFLVLCFWCKLNHFMLLFYERATLNFNVRLLQS